MILCDVAREDASVILSDLKALTSTRTVALAVGFPLAIGLVYLATLLARATDLMREDFHTADHQIADLIASPDAFAVIVALCAGAAACCRSRPPSRAR